MQKTIHDILASYRVDWANLLSQTCTAWTQQSAIPLHSVGVCSDVEVGENHNKDEKSIAKLLIGETRIRRVA